MVKVYGEPASATSGFDQFIITSVRLQTMDYKSIISRFLNLRSVKVGLPFFLMIVGGSFGLREFTQLRYKYTKVSSISRQQLAESGFKLKKPEETTLEAQYEKVAEADIDNWKNIRIPRPWEENVDAK